MTQVIIVRVGSPVHNWDTKFSSPSMPTHINNQTIRNLFVEQYPLIVIFVGTGDIPISMASVDNVRPRHPIEDANYPIGNIQGLYETFFTFRQKYPITASGKKLIQPILDYIRFIPGQQIHINHMSALSAVLLHTINTVNLNINNTYINSRHI
jgi:hypothetical protein